MNIAQILLKCIGRTIAYGLGRFLYMQARGDIPNNMTQNGELMVQRCVIQAVLRSVDDKLVFLMWVQMWAIGPRHYWRTAGQDSINCSNSMCSNQCHRPPVFKERGSMAMNAFTTRCRRCPPQKDLM